MLVMTLTATAQVELLFHYQNGQWSHYSAMDRTKKLYWMDDDSNTCFEIKDYKKSGNTETFTLEAKEKGMGMDYAHVTTTLDADGHTATIQYKEAIFYGGKKFDVKTTSPDGPREQNRLLRYFNRLAGNPIEQGVVNETTPAVSQTSESETPSAPQAQTTNPTDKVKGAAKDAVGKVKGIFKKK